VSSCMKGYYEDEFIREFIGRDCKRSPLINRGYYARVAAMDMVISRFLDNIEGEPCQIISLGAGSDTTFFRLNANKRNPTLFIEVDLPGIVEKKLNIYRNSSRVQNILGLTAADIDASKKHLQLITPNYALTKVDLRNVEEMDNILATQVPGFSYLVPTLFISECVFCYIAAKDSGKVLQWITNKFPVAAFMSYEQIRPNDPFGKTMIGHFKNKGCPLLSIDEYPDPNSQQLRLESFGFPFAQVFDMNDIYYKYLDKVDLKRAEKLEIFDEFEEWHMMQAHYCILLGVTDVVSLAQVKLSL